MNFRKVRGWNCCYTKVGWQNWILKKLKDEIAVTLKLDDQIELSEKLKDEIAFIWKLDGRIELLLNLKDDIAII